MGMGIYVAVWILAGLVARALVWRYWDRHLPFMLRPCYIASARADAWTLVAGGWVSLGVVLVAMLVAMLVARGR